MQDLLSSYIAEHYVTSPSGLTTVADFVGSFRSWCAMQGKRPPKRGDIIEALTATGFALGEYNGQMMIAGVEVATPKFTIVDGRIVRAARAVSPA